MSEVSDLTDTLKQLMREKEVNQADVGAVLGLGLARVKQMFAKNDFSVKRLVTVCNELLEIELSDLVLITEERKRQIRSLTQAQETLLTSDTRLLVVAVSVLTNWRLDEIVSRYNIAEKECKTHLRTLESFKLIQIQDNWRIKILVDHNFRWLENGPLESYFMRNVQSDFLNSAFHGDGELKVFRTGMLSKKSVDELHRRIEKMIAKFVELNRDDSSMPLENRCGYSMIVAVRPWLMPAFTKLLRES